jgi:hypothetical protein
MATARPCGCPQKAAFVIKAPPIWLDIGQLLGVDFEKIDVRQWVIGCQHETEHSETVKGNKIIIARIAWDHLKEDPDYYKKLKAVEKT